LHSNNIGGSFNKTDKNLNDFKWLEEMKKENIPAKLKSGTSLPSSSYQHRKLRLEHLQFVEQSPAHLQN
jgi:hypothetical protein